MKRLLALALLLPLAAPALLWAADVDTAKPTMQEALTRLALARQALAFNPPKDALMNSPLASHPMFNQVFATIDQNKLNETAATLMAEQFTEPELKALVAFQSSPEGRSIAAKMPTYQQLLGATLQNYLSVAFQQYMAHQGSASNLPANIGQTPAAASPPPAAVPVTIPAGLQGQGTPIK